MLNANQGKFLSSANTHCEAYTAIASYLQLIESIYKKITR
jgi:hypothetical protein